MRTTLKQAKVPEKSTFTRAELREFIIKKLNGKLSKKYCLHMADRNYYVPPLKVAEKMIQDSKMSDLPSSAGKKRSDRFDCDDYALLLKARFAFDAYRKEDTYYNFAHCFGIVWGMLPYPFPHSLNWMVAENEHGDKEFYFVEPQKQEIYPLEKCKNFRYINFILV